MSRKVLFICKSRTTQYGYTTSSGLLNSARMVSDALIEHHIKSKVVSVIDANAIDKEIVKYKATHVVLEALWVSPAKVNELAKLHKHVEFIVRIHSKAPFIAGEGIAFDWIIKIANLKHHNVHIAANSTEFTSELKQTLDIPVIYLPNIYMQDKDFAHRPGHKHLSIGCFGATRLLKNQLLQALAAIEFADSIDKSLHFHINVARLEMRGDEVLKNLRALFAALPKHRLVEHDWLEHDEFLELVRKMDLGMQVSYTESFNIVTGDFVSQGVPIVVSHDISWMPDIYKVDANSSNAIAKKLSQLNASNRKHVADTNWEALEEFNKHSTKAWLGYLA